MRGRIIDWWRRRRMTRPRLDRVRSYARRADLPANLPRHELAVLGDPVSPKWLLLECPCGNGHRLQIDLDARHAPNWRLERRGPDVYPSIDYRGPERRCHFWLKDGRVRWALDPVGPRGSTP
jgi:hypothetical protein